MLNGEQKQMNQRHTGHAVKRQRSAEEVLRAVGELPPDMPREEQVRRIAEVMDPVDADPKLTKILNKIRDYQKKLHLPLDVGKRSVMVNAPVKFEFPIVDDLGRMTWQFFMVYAVLFVLAWLLKNIATYISHYCMRWVSTRVIAFMAPRLFSANIDNCRIIIVPSFPVIPAPPASGPVPSFSPSPGRDR